MILQKRFLFIIILLLLAGFITANQYYPNGAKDIYTYQSEWGGEITDSVTAVLGNWKLHTQVGGFGQIYVYTTANTNILRVHTNGITSQLANFDDPVNTRYKYEIDTCNRGVSVIGAKGLTISVPAGTFTDVIRLDFIPNSNCADVGIVAQWYARDVGIIQWEEITIAGPRRTKLLSATVGDISYPLSITATGLSMIGNIDRYEYWVNMMPPGYTNPVLQFQGELCNKTDSDIELLFTSGQVYDAILYDEKGREITRWSAGKFFIESIQRRILGPGECLGFKDELELAYPPDDTPLEAGNYSLEIIITSARPWKVLLNLEVDRAY